MIEMEKKKLSAELDLRFYESSLVILVKALPVKSTVHVGE